MSLLTQGRITNPLAPKLSPADQAAGTSQFQSIISAIVGWFFVVAVILFFFYFIIGAIKWITSGGDKNAVESARNTILQAVIGLAVIFTMFAAIKIIEGAFGVCILNFTLPGLDQTTLGKSCVPIPTVPAPVLPPDVPYTPGRDGVPF